MIRLQAMRLSEMFQSNKLQKFCRYKKLFHAMSSYTTKFWMLLSDGYQQGY